MREQVQKLVHLGIWENLPPQQLEAMLKGTPKLKKYWSAIQKRDRQQTDQSVREW